jgi:hypothetical protein
MLKKLMFFAVLVLVGLSAAMPLPASAGVSTQELTAQSRPRITIYPRQVHPNAKRYCRAWLAKEYRVSGPVIVPQQQCWWQ